MARTRKIITASLAIAALAGTAVAHDTLAQSAKRPMTVDDMMTLKNAGGVAISPNGSQVGYVVSAWEHPNANPAKGDTARGAKYEMPSHLWLAPTRGSRP